LLAPTVKFLILQKQKPIHRWILKFSETETRISIDYAQIGVRYCYLTKGLGGGGTTFTSGTIRTSGDLVYEARSQL